MARDLARELYKAFRNQPRRNRNTNVDESRTKIDDPQKFSDVLGELIVKRDWRQGLAEGNIFTDWKKIVGEEIASHCSPISLVDGELTIQSTSTAWATQLGLIQGELIKTISACAPGALVESLRIFGPNAPSWKKGLRTVRNARGPRDTYG
jgi:predicted nucleic acid-binding Zn ribbon protein